MQTMKTFATLLLAAALPISAQTKTGTAPVNPKTVQEVHDSAIVIDTHADTTQRLVDENYDLTDPLNGGQLNFESAKKGNLGAEFFSIWVEPELYKGHDAKRTLDLIDAVYQQAAKHPDKMEMAFTAADIEKAHRDHKLAALMGIEGGHSIENSLGLLRDYYRLGVRYMTLTWSNSLDWANSSGDEGKPGVPHNPDGLTPFGKEVVLEMNRLGMMVDISHVADDTFWAAIKTTKAPLIASHSSARSIDNAPRNMTDDMLRAVAKNGGVVQVNYYSGFIGQAYRDASAAQEAEVKKATADLKAKYAAEGKQVTYGDLEKLQRSYADRIPRPAFSILIDHIDHIAKVAGVDHTGLGSDFDGVSGQLPEGMDSAADLPKITAALLERGYSAEDCHKILGGNLLRVMREVERVSRQIQAESK
jgi:membrane dipeptidase